MYLDKKILDQTISKLIEKFGIEHNARIERGVRQTGQLWNESDGSDEDFANFCIDHFISDEKILDDTLSELDRLFEAAEGHFNAMMQAFQDKIHLDQGPLYPLDLKWGGYNPAAHFDDDLFNNKIAFTVLLNFPHYDLAEKKKQGESWTDRDWAMTRLSEGFISRVPANLQQKQSEAKAAADSYISEYNIYLGNLHNRNNHRVFPKDLKLITHWGLRDELKSLYGKDDGLEKQEIIYEVMQRIITQEIPAEIINNPELRWNPFENMVYREGKGQGELAAAESDDRYQHILDFFHIELEIDKLYPDFPTFIKRKFDLGREMSEAEVVALFNDCLQAPQFANTGRLIEKRLGRPLQPFDIWYDGFKARGGISQDTLDETTRRQYPSLEAFQNDLPNILTALNFDKETAQFVAERVVVDPARGAGHAWGSDMKGWPSHLRTRVPRGGMDYKGFNIGMHELGHCVEQVFSIERVPYHFMNGVPFTGFSEAFAFIFQTRDLKILNLTDENPDKKSLMVLDRYWGTCEIMAVALTELKIWNWLYQNPGARAADLKKATIDTAKEIWNKYFAGIFGVSNELILGIYSHMVDHPLYLAEYPLGHLIEFQLEKYLENKKIGPEMERVCSMGNIMPQLWMKRAVGTEISVKPLINAVDEALKIVG